MPELPEVETVRRALVKQIKNQIISEYQCLRSDYLRTGSAFLPSMAGAKILQIERKGKLLAIYLSNHLVLLHHLGMSGRIVFFPQETPLEIHTHLRIQFKNGWEIRQRDPRRFGYAAIIPERDLSIYPSWARMGIDPFDLTISQFRDMLQNRSKPIKNFLLDQTHVAGIGNIYADEALFRAKIHPLTRCNNVSSRKAGNLLQHLQKVLEESIEAGGSSTHDFQTLDGTLGEFQHHHNVYRRNGLPCPHCGRTIARIITAGRSTHFCPRCQPKPKNRYIQF